MSKLQLNLDQSETRLILEGLTELERKWLAICETSTDEDEVADYGNDLIELRLLLKSVRHSAIAEFGLGITNFDRTPL
jgi:hypothetical protein